MKEVASGVVSRIGQNGKSFQLAETDSKWFGAFNTSQLADAQIGDKVSFAYTSKEVGDKVYHNIQGNVTITGGSGSTPPPQAAAAGQTSLVRDRLILRQNALTNAVKAMELQMKDGGDFNVEEVVSIAREFEAYTSGDSDIKPVKSKSEPSDEDWQEAAGKLRAAS